MTADQFARKIQKLWVTQKDAAEALGVTRSCIGHYEHGRRPVPAPIVKLLKCLEAANHVAQK